MTQSCKKKSRKMRHVAKESCSYNPRSKAMHCRVGTLWASISFNVQGKQWSVTNDKRCQYQVCCQYRPCHILLVIHRPCVLIYCQYTCTIIFIWINIRLSLQPFTRSAACIYVYVCMYVCMHACMHGMYVCLYVYIYTYMNINGTCMA